jgi:hypothetical protein
MNEKTRAFIEDFRLLLSKYNMEVDYTEDYDGHDQFCGYEIKIGDKEGNVWIYGVKELYELLHSTG